MGPAPPVASSLRRADPQLDRRRPAAGPQPRAGISTRQPRGRFGGLSASDSGLAGRCVSARTDATSRSAVASDRQDG
eukprot:tig00000540_g1919.t1